jgi:hypothetical protein
MAFMPLKILYLTGRASDSRLSSQRGKKDRCYSGYSLERLFVVIRKACIKFLKPALFKGQ